jgi:hypothetical protein
MSMAPLVIEPVTTRRRRKQFLELPWRLYRGDPNWVPPLRADQAEMVGYRRHPFYARNRAQTFLAFRNGEPCGRIAAILNRAHIEFCNERRGFFGFFECIDDQEAAAGLFDAARAWLAERDIHAMRGPMSPAINYVIGTLVEGFDAPPTFMMAYNPPYHDRLIQGCGLRKAQDLYAYWADRAMLPASRERHWPVIDQIKERFSVRVRPLDKSRFRQDVRDFLAIYNRSMERHWGFSPMSEEELNHTARVLRHLVIPEMIVGAEIDGRLVGLVLVLPDYNPRIKAIDGRLFPFGFLRLLWGKRKIGKVRVLAANVLPEYQLLGVALVLMKELAVVGMDSPVQEVEYSWIAESNALSRGALEKGGAKRVKTYRLYDSDA